jgi:TPR repeat protein
MVPYAAQQGYGAQVSIGGLYRDGQGLPQDYKEAVRWFRMSAVQGDASGQLGLGMMYADGHGVRQDYVQAHMWLASVLSFET